MRFPVLHVTHLLIRGLQYFLPTQWPRGLRRGSAVARLLGLRVRIPSGAWMSVRCVCCMLSGTGSATG